MGHCEVAFMRLFLTRPVQALLMCCRAFLTRFGRRPSAATVIATFALFVALGGTGYAAVALAPNSVGSAQIKEGAVQSSDIKDGTIGSADIAAGAIQASDLSKVAVKALDGKDGAQGPAGPRGATGATGPAGRAGSGSGGGFPPVIDVNGNEVPNVIQGSVAYDFATNSVANFWIIVDGVNWRVLNDGHLEVLYSNQRNRVIWFNNTCTGQAYLLNPGITGDDLLATIFSTPRDGTDSPALWVADSSTFTQWTTGTPRSGYNDDGVCLHDESWGEYNPDQPTEAAVPVSRRGPVVPPTVLAGPFHFEPTTN